MNSAGLDNFTCKGQWFLASGTICFDEPLYFWG
jgi:hypothetical protein